MQEQYNELTVLGEVTDKRRRKYLLRCSCGKEIVRRKDHVHNGRVRMCKSCASKETAKAYPPPINRKGCGSLSGTHFNHIKHTAERRSLQFDLDAEYLNNLYKDQEEKCALTGVPIILSTNIRNNNVDWEFITASLDRIDNSKGYVKGNVWWVHKEVNRLKNNYSLNDLLYWSKLIVDKHGDPDPSPSNGL